MNLSKVNDCVPNIFLIAKLECNDVGKASLRLSLDHLTRRKQRTKIGSSFSSWCDISQKNVILQMMITLFLVVIKI